jgi:hypothetical protein
MDRTRRCWGWSLLRAEKEWRLPTAKELASLADPAQHDPAWPKGHPFLNIKSAIFWTATSSATDEMLACM